MLRITEKTLRGVRLYIIIVAICVAATTGIGLSMEASDHFAKPGYVPPLQTASLQGHCYSFELNCHNPVTHDKSYYTTGAYLDQPAS